MYIFNQTFSVDPSVFDTWTGWTKTEYIPEVMASGFFEQFLILKLLSPIAENQHTYALQFFANEQIQIEEVEQLFELNFEFKIATKFGDKVLFFRTLLENSDLD